MRQLWLFFGLVVLIVVPFVLWGDTWTQRFSLSGSISWLQNYGRWAWLAGILLLIADIVLPVPGTLVMSALGYIYGPVLGSLFAAVGSFSAGVVGYWACRALGQRAAVAILGKQGLEKGRKMFDRVGGWLVVLSRWMPVFPEVIACMAGLNRMSVLVFHLALVCSAIPMGIVYAVIGHAGAENLTWALMVSAGLPPIIWLVLGPIIKKMTE